MENYYETIGVSENATQEEIKKAYKKKAIQHHPDKGGDEEMFKKISVAFDTIGDACTLQYVNAKWFCTGNNGAVFA